MEVLGASDYLVRQIGRLRRVLLWLVPFQMAFVVASVAAWGVLAWVLWRQEIGLANWAVAAVANLSVLALGLPHWVDGLSAEIETHTKQLAAQQATANLFQSLLDDSWNLYQNIRLPEEQGKLDAILVGSGGIFLLHILNLSGTYQNSRSKWLRRASDQSWQLAKISPTRESKAQAERLVAWLQTQEIETIVQPRLIWAGDGLILQEEPEVPLWLVNQETAVRDELHRLDKTISAETRTSLHKKLKSLISAPQQLSGMPLMR